MSTTPAVQHDHVVIDARRADPRFVAALLSFEMLFMLFLMAGRYKADPRFQWITEWTSIDLTALLFGGCGLAATVIILGKKHRLSAASPAFLLAAAAFFGYVVLSVLWTPGGAYARSKLLHVGVLTAGTLASCTVIVASRRYRVERLFVVFAGFCVWLAVESMLAHFRTGSGRSVMALGGNYLGLGRMIGAAALMTLSYALFLARPGLPRVGGLVLTVGFCVVLLVLGGRMPLLATAAGALVPLVFVLGLDPRYTREWSRWVYGGLLILAAVFVVYLFVSSETPQTLRRMSALMDGDLDSSAYGRLESYESAVHFWWEQPVFGHGIGAWPILHLRNDVRAYPHNLVLEVLVEFGLAGLLLLGAMMACAWRSLGTLREIVADPLRITIVMLLVNALCNAMVSGDLSDNRFLFGVLGLACLPRMRRDEP
jgi:O-antigen ligase